VTFDDLRDLMLAFPGAVEGTSYGTPAFRVRGKYLCRMHEDGESLVLKVDDAVEREGLLALQPDVFYVTDHYVATTLLLVRLSSIELNDFRDVIERAWRRLASKRDLKSGPA
jgi:hypothetical protein